MALIAPALAVAALLADLPAPAAAPFARYPAAATGAARAAPLRLVDERSRRYRSALREAAHRTADFAGHYVLARIGCGAGCLSLAAIDRRSGRIVWFPATVSGWPLAVIDPLTFRRNSRLLVVQGMLDEREPAATRRYVLEGDRFRLVPGS